jgi:hypothetical protein
VVDVADRAHVHMRLRSLKSLLCHFCFPRFVLSANVVRQGLHLCDGTDNVFGFLPLGTPYHALWIGPDVKKSLFGLLVGRFPELGSEAIRRPRSIGAFEILFPILFVQIR